MCPPYEEVDKVASRWKSFGIIAAMGFVLVIAAVVVWKVFF